MEKIRKTIAEEFDDIVKGHLDSCISDLGFIQEWMKIPATKAILEKKFTRELATLVHLGVEI